MHFFLLAACLVAAVIAQPPPGDHHHPDPDRPDWFQTIDDYLNVNDDVIDRYHDYRFEYHAPPKGEHLMIAIDDQQDERECHFVEIMSEWEPLLNSTAAISAISEEIYNLIHIANTPETAMTIHQLGHTYGDHEAVVECLGHKVFVLSYTPSKSLTMQYWPTV